jgi:hypothetical protein
MFEDDCLTTCVREVTDCHIAVQRFLVWPPFKNCAESNRVHHLQPVRQSGKIATLRCRGLWSGLLSRTAQRAMGCITCSRCVNLARALHTLAEHEANRINSSSAAAASLVVVKIVGEHTICTHAGQIPPLETTFLTKPGTYSGLQETHTFVIPCPRIKE